MIHWGSFELSRAKFDRRISLETHDRQRVRLPGRPEMGRWASMSRSPQADEETIEFGFFQAWLGRSMVAREQMPQTTAPRKKPRRRMVTRAEASSTRPRPGYPSSGCSPAEPDSVSPGKGDYSSARPPADNSFQNRPKAPTGSACCNSVQTTCKDGHQKDTNRSLRSTRTHGRNGIETTVHLPILTRPSLA